MEQYEKEVENRKRLEEEIEQIRRETALK